MRRDYPFELWFTLAFALFLVFCGLDVARGQSAYYAVTQSTAAGKAAGRVSGSWSVAENAASYSTYTIILDGGLGLRTTKPVQSLGGDARGSGANDLQTCRAASADVASGANSVIAGGCSNKASGTYSIIGGGDQNSASGAHSHVGGGAQNSASNSFSYVGGGSGNQAAGYNAAVAGGTNNVASSSRTFVGGGTNNAASNEYAAVLSGINNTASNIYSVVAGGDTNSASGGDAFVGSGAHNAAAGGLSVIAGGDTNSVAAAATYGAIAGGANNVITSSFGVVAGGGSNRASGLSSAVGGGAANAADGAWAVVPGGNSNQAQGNYSWAGGYKSSSTAAGAFTWSDSEGTAVVNSVSDSFRIKARGGVLISGSTNYADHGFRVDAYGRVAVSTPGVAGVPFTVRTAADKNIAFNYGTTVVGAAKLYTLNDLAAANVPLEYVASAHYFGGGYAVFASSLTVLSTDGIYSKGALDMTGVSGTASTAIILPGGGAKIRTNGATTIMGITGTGNTPIAKFDVGANRVVFSSSTIIVDGTGVPSTGGALCLNASKQLSKCTSAIDASGNCTCP